MQKSILDAVYEKTKEFLAKMPKSERKKKGQFFTSRETACYMANMFDLSKMGEDVNLCDPGSGTGILSAAIIDRLRKEVSVQSIHLTCYETDECVRDLLEKNLNLIKSLVNKRFTFEIVTDNYLTSQSHDFGGDLLASRDPKKYDLIISNPPYLRISRNAEEAIAMPAVVHGSPNLYFLFASMSLFNLKDNAEMVYIIPRSWTSGAYFASFRKYLLTVGKLSHIHLFVSRNKVFKEEDVLQETMIVKVKKSTKQPRRVTITSSHSNNDFNNVTEISVPYSSVVSGKDLYVFLPTSDEEVDIIRQINTYENTLPDEGLRMRTGIVVDFRQFDELRNAPGEHVVPLFYSHHIKNGRIHHNPSGKEHDWIIDSKPSLIQKNKNYVFCKRFTAKEESRRLQCGVYLSKDFPDYEYIGTQNKINFVDRKDGKDMDKSTAYGVYALLNSTLFDMYYRILNGSTQVNSTEVNSIPVPPMKMIKEMGKRLIASGDLSTENCDNIMSEVAYE